MSSHAFHQCPGEAAVTKHSAIDAHGLRRDSSSNLVACCQASNREGSCNGWVLRKPKDTAHNRTGMSENSLKSANLLTDMQEAAALYTLKNLSPGTLKVGRKFVVCDAGGGTVDLISYEVSQVGKLEVKEVTEGTGGKCGSSMLNMRFRRHLKQAHGDKYWTDTRLVTALNDFEAVCNHEILAGES